MGDIYPFLSNFRKKEENRMVKVRVKRRKKRPKIHIPLFRIFAVLFGLMICFMLIKIPQTISRAEKTIVEVESSKNAYFSAEAKNRRLMEQDRTSVV